MMKTTNINLLTFLLAALTLGLSACSDHYEPVLQENPDARIREALEGYRETLLQAPNGWKAILSTGTGKDYFYYFNFNEDGTVTMLADFNETAAGEAMSGTWKLKALQRPTLSFDTYSYIHLPADPDGNVNGGANGEGLISDIEFALGETNGDSLLLHGIQRGSRMALLRATAEEATAVMGGRLKEMVEYVSTTHGLQFVLPGGKTVTLALSNPHKLLGAQYISADGTKVENFNATYTFTTEGIALKNALDVDGLMVNNILWDSDRKVFFIQNGIDITSHDELFIFTPSIPLHSILGTEYKGLQVPRNSGTYPLPGQSTEFADKYNEVKASLQAGQYRLTLNEINYHFEAAAGNLLIDVIISRDNDLFLAHYRYAYTVTDDGTFSFVFQDADQNGWAIQGDMIPLLSYFDTDSFKMEYVGGGFGLIGGMFSQQNPGYSFSGYLFEDDL